MNLPVADSVRGAGGAAAGVLSGFLGIGGGRLYSAYDIAMLAARLHRKRAMTPLRDIPRYVRNPQPEKQTTGAMNTGPDMLQGLTDQR